MTSRRFLTLALVMLGVSIMSEAQSQKHVFEYRKYFAMPGKLEDLKARFRNHTIRIFEKHGMKNIGYWIPQDNKDNALVYVLQHDSKEAATKSWADFRTDPEWTAAQKASEANGKLVDHIESYFMDAADFSKIQ